MENRVKTSSYVSYCKKSQVYKLFAQNHMFPAKQLRCTQISGLARLTANLTSGIHMSVLEWYLHDDVSASHMAKQCKEMPGTLYEINFSDMRIIQ